jgi:hypothetical protein
MTAMSGGNVLIKACPNRETCLGTPFLFCGEPQTEEAFTNAKHAE